MGKVISSETKEQIKILSGNHSISEISAKTGLCKSSVCNVMKELHIERTPEQLKRIRSRIRIKLIQDEKRRALFGKETKTNLKLFTNKPRIRLKYKMKRVGYFCGDKPNKFHYNESTRRNLKYEEMAKTLGLYVTPA